MFTKSNPPILKSADRVMNSCILLHRCLWF